jgi:FMN-dependent oxidoreductase (nitrilotriacetate monooxygenase family)
VPNDSSAPMRFTHFTSFAPAGPPRAMWDHPKSLGFDYLDLQHWIKLAKALEEAKFDAFFWADHSGVHDIYQGSYDTAVREAMQFPLGDPLVLTAALASSTTDLGFAFSANVIQDHPYVFARRLSTLDHLTNGRIAWNVVTSFQPSAWRNLGFDEVASHADRYERAEEYLTVLYKLLEGSWENDAVVRDRARRIYADPSKVHEIKHAGKYYRVPGIHTNEPSVQRVPFLFQAGSSEDGREFAARNAEAMFLVAHSTQGAARVIEDMRRRLRANGRHEADMLYFVSGSYVIGSTEEEAKRKNAELDEFLLPDTLLAYPSSTLGLDLAEVELDTPVAELHVDALQGQIRGLVESAPDKRLTIRDLVLAASRAKTVGTPEQIVDQIERWREVGVTGINVNHLSGPDETYDFIEHVVPLLKKRGLMQHEYHEGSLREKLFAGTPAASGPRLNPRHPAHRYGL